MIRFLHIIWVIAAIAVSVMIVQSKGSHPPALVLLPVMVGVWLLGHIILWISQWVVRRSSKSIFADQTMRQRWPPAVVLVTVSLGLTCFASTIIAIILYIRNNTQDQVVALAVLAAISALLFIGLLMRKNWARLMVIVLLLGTAAWVAMEMGQAIWKAYNHPANDWLIASGIVIVLLGLGLHLLKSKRVRMYFGAL